MPASVAAVPIPALPSLDAKQRYTILEAARYLRCSRAHLYQCIAAGEISVIHDRRRVYVPGSEIARRSALPAAETAKGAT